MEAGIPKEVTSTNINMLCGSGLKAVALGYQAIRSQDAKLVVAGGQESMSQVRAQKVVNLYFCGIPYFGGEGGGSHDLQFSSPTFMLFLKIQLVL